MHYVIKRTDQGGGYYAGPGKKNTYVRSVRYAHMFTSKEEAELEVCLDNEIVIAYDIEFS